MIERAIELTSEIGRLLSKGIIQTVDDDELSNWYLGLNTIKKALQEQQERENPQPLTADTLYFMDGHPVWWWNKSHAPVCTLCVKNKADANNPFFVCFDDPFADDDCTGIVKYRKLIKWGWRPYQYPPKEAQSEN